MDVMNTSKLNWYKIYWFRPKNPLNFWKIRKNDLFGV